MACVPSEDSDQPGHLFSLIRVFAVHMRKAWVLSYPLSTPWRLWSVWVDAQTDLSLLWVLMPFCWFYHVAAHLSQNTITPSKSQASSKDSDQPVHLRCMIRVFTVCVKNLWVLGYTMNPSQRLHLCGVLTWFCRYCCAQAHFSFYMQLNLAKSKNEKKNIYFFFISTSFSFSFCNLSFSSISLSNSCILSRAVFSGPHRRVYSTMAIV